MSRDYTYSTYYNIYDFRSHAATNTKNIKYTYNAKVNLFINKFY